ncbi:hypothetical protein DAPPUDRAFT_122717, partial [Daphnia pulex]
MRLARYPKVWQQEQGADECCMTMFHREFWIAFATTLVWLIKSDKLCCCFFYLNHIEHESSSLTLQVDCLRRVIQSGLSSRGKAFTSIEAERVGVSREVAVCRLTCSWTKISVTSPWAHRQQMVRSSAEHSSVNLGEVHKKANGQP